ncbi:MAG: sensor histidine kinase [Streptosporangiales bacterium]|nr:sensor histidine kinase [Streptosporangiales bacterium]
MIMVGPRSGLGHLPEPAGGGMPNGEQAPASHLGPDDPRPFEHSALVYRTPEEYVARVVGFVREGLAKGAPTLVVASGERREALCAELGPAQSAVRFADADTWFHSPGRTLAAYHRFVARHRREVVHLCGEPVWRGRSPLEVREWHRYESVLNHAFSGLRVRLMCAYESRTLGPEIVSTARRTHPLLTGRGRSAHYLTPREFSRELDREPPVEPTGPTATFPVHDDLGGLRDRVERQAALMGLPGRRVPDLVLAVNEIAANVVEHGAGRGAATLWIDEDRLVCDVLDEAGRLTDPLTGYSPADVLSVRGYGLWITRQVCDLVEIRPVTDGSLIRLHVKLS